MKNNYGFFLLLLSLTVFCQDVKGQVTEKLEQWIFPVKNNFVSLKSKTNSEDFFRINYFKISNHLVGTSLEIGLMNSEPSAKLFEIGNDEISLIRTKDGASFDSGGEEYTFGKNNIYFKLPTSIGTTKWSYADESGTIYYGLCYWEESKEKLLVIERQMSGRHQFPEKTVEYYSKGRGLVKQENINIKTGKFTESYALEESGFDSQMDIQDFPLFDSIETIEKDKPSETKEQSKITNQPQNNISYPDGTIPKEYVLQITLDKGLPYDIKDSITIKNRRGLDGVLPPKYVRQENSVYYDGNKIYNGGDNQIKDFKITNIKYFKSPFSFNLQLYYYDGEGNFRKVENKKMLQNFDILSYLENNFNAFKNSFANYYFLKEDFLMKEEIKKDSELYKELANAKIKKQGIFLIIEATNEENQKSFRSMPFNFNTDSE